jgi:hypothetical protein
LTFCRFVLLTIVLQQALTTIIPDGPSPSVETLHAAASQFEADITCPTSSTILEATSSSAVCLRSEMEGAGHPAVDAFLQHTTTRINALLTVISELEAKSQTLSIAFSTALEDDAHGVVEESQSVDVEEVVDARGKMREDGLPQEERFVLPAQGIRRPSNRIIFTSPEDVEDVFGTQSTIFFPFDSTPEEPTEVMALRSQLNAIPVDEWLDIQAVLQLPTVEQAEQLERQLSAMDAQIDEFEGGSTGAALWLELTPVKAELDRKVQALKGIASLAQFRDKVDVADVALSNLLNSIDASTLVAPELPPDDDSTASSSSNGPQAPTPLADALLAASDAVTAVRKDAIPLVDDTRVKNNVERIEEAYGEMMGMVDDLKPRSHSSASSSSHSPKSTRPTTSRPSSRASSRTASRPLSSQSSTSSRRLFIREETPSVQSSRPSSSRGREPRQPFSSMQTPAPRQVLVDSPTPRRRTSCSIPTTTPRPTSTIPRGFSFGSTSKGIRTDLSRSTSSIPPASSHKNSLGTSSASVAARVGRRESAPFSRRDSTASLASSTSSLRSSYGVNTATRYSRASMEKTRRASSTWVTPPKQKKFYKANPNRKVDVEVGRIVNQLDVSFIRFLARSISPLTIRPTHRSTSPSLRPREHTTMIAGCTGLEKRTRSVRTSAVSSGRRR